MKPSLELAHQRIGAGDGVGIAVDRKDRAIGSFQDGAGIAAGPERAVDIDGAVLRA